MTIMEMLEQSAVLTVLGVGVVFSFLTLLIICITNETHYSIGNQPSKMGKKGIGVYCMKKRK